MAETSNVWKCHPDLEAEWNNFAIESKQSATTSNLNSDLWLNFWNRGEIKSNTLTQERLNSGDMKIGSEEKDKILSLESEEMLSEVQVPAIDVSVSNSQLEAINSIALELVDALEMDDAGIPDELREDISKLPQQALPVLLTELKSQLSDECLHKLCVIVCEETDTHPCLDIALVFEHLLLPKFQEDGHKSSGAQISAAVLNLCKHSPSVCTSHFLKPLTLSENTAASQLELLSNLMPLLPEKDFLALLRHIICECKSPLTAWQVSVLNSILTYTKADVPNNEVESALLDLLPFLSSSGRSLSSSESFASLLLKVIPALKHNISSRVCSELVALVQQNSSFNKQALVNAIKELG